MSANTLPTRRNFLSTMAAASISAMLLGSCSSDVQHPAAPTGDAAPGSNPKPDTLFRNVRVLDVRAGRLGQPTDVLIRGNTIAAIGTGQPVTDNCNHPQLVPLLDLPAG